MGIRGRVSGVRNVGAGFTDHSQLQDETNKPALISAWGEKDYKGQKLIKRETGS